MSDPAAELQAALLTTLRADLGVIAAFGTAKVKIFEVPPTNEPCPYVVLQSTSVTPQVADCMDLAEAEVTPTVWTRSDPPALAPAMRLGAAVAAACLSLNDLPSFRIVQALAVRSTYLMDADGKTAKGAIAIRYSTDPYA